MSGELLFSRFWLIFAAFRAGGGAVCWWYPAARRVVFLYQETAAGKEELEMA